MLPDTCVRTKNIRACSGMSHMRLGLFSLSKANVKRLAFHYLQSTSLLLCSSIGNLSSFFRCTVGHSARTGYHGGLLCSEWLFQTCLHVHTCLRLHFDRPCATMRTYLEVHLCHGFCGVVGCRKADEAKAWSRHRPGPRKDVFWTRGALCFRCRSLIERILILSLLLSPCFSLLCCCPPFMRTALSSFTSRCENA